MPEENLKAVSQPLEGDILDQDVGLLDSIIEKTALRQEDDGFAIAKTGLRTLMRELVRRTRRHQGQRTSGR